MISLRHDIQFYVLIVLIYRIDIVIGIACNYISYLFSRDTKAMLQIIWDLMINLICICGQNKNMLQIDFR